MLTVHALLSPQQVRFVLAIHSVLALQLLPERHPSLLRCILAERYDLELPYQTILVRVARLSVGSRQPLQDATKLNMNPNHRLECL